MRLISLENQGSRQEVDGKTPEIWRPVAGYLGRYEVSDRGRVRHVGAKRCMRPQRHWRGYLRVQLYGGAGRRRRNHRIHLLVAGAFIGPRPAGFTVDHLDGDKRNNAAANLEYVGRLENYMRHLARARARTAAGLQRADAGIAARAAVIGAAA